MGITGKVIRTCQHCGTKTEHTTDWDSEAPDDLTEECTVCGQAQLYRGNSIFPVVFRPARLDIEKYRTAISEPRT